MNDYESQLAAWKEKHGLDPKSIHNEDELRMIGEELNSARKSWCCECDAHLPIREMKLITRRIDPYRQIDEGASDYIAKGNRVRMCQKCFESNYRDSTSPPE